MEETLQQLDGFFNPSSVAVIGATKKVDKAGHVIFKNFATNKERGVFKGELYPVNPGRLDFRLPMLQVPAADSR